MTWIDFKKAYDMFSQTWIIECLKMNKIFNKDINFGLKAMKNWRGKNQERHLPGRLTTTICYCKDAIQLHT